MERRKFLELLPKTIFALTPLAFVEACSSQEVPNTTEIGGKEKVKTPYFIFDNQLRGYRILINNRALEKVAEKYGFELFDHQLMKFELLLEETIDGSPASMQVNKRGRATVKIGSSLYGELENFCPGDDNLAPSRALSEIIVWGHIALTHWGKEVMDQAAENQSLKYSQSLTRCNREEFLIAEIFFEPLDVV